MKLKNFKGTRDYFYKDYKNRERILSIIKEKFEVCGFTGLDTPAIEYIENLYPEGKLIYCLAYKGGNEAALRYDLTVPMARFVSQHFHTLRFPFKRYQIQKVWRADSPQFGRYREFYQCDADIVVHKTSDPTEIKSSNISTVRELGVNISSHEESKYIDENLYDVIEILRMASKILSSLNMGNFKIAINNRKLMDFISIKILRIPEEKIPSFYILLDKKNKLEKSEFDKELQPYLSYLQIDCEEFYKIFKHIQQEMLDSIISSINQVELNFEPKKFFKLIESIINDDQSFGDSEQKEILELMINFSNLFKIGDPMKMKEISNIDLFLVRGLNYYTSWIYEGSFDEEPNLSVCAGGTYSDLFKVPNVELEGIGISFGLDRIFSIFKKQEEKKQKQERKSPLVKVLFCASRVEVNFWPRNFDSIQIIGGLLWQLRERNISADVYYKRMLISKQIQYAAENHIPVVVYITKWDTNIDFTDLLGVEVLERWERTIKVMVRFLSYRADIPAKKEEIPLDQLVNRLEEFFRNWNEDEYFGNKK